MIIIEEYEVGGSLDGGLVYSVLDICRVGPMLDKDGSNGRR